MPTSAELKTKITSGPLTSEVIPLPTGISPNLMMRSKIR